MSKQITLFPEQVNEAILKELAPIDHQGLVSSAERLTKNFREKREEEKTFIYSSRDVAGYLALRTPATYAQMYGALSQLKEVLPSFRPHSLLDIGSGPGTATWAVAEIFPSLRQVKMLEKQKEFISLSKNIAAAYPKLNIEWKQTNFLTDTPHLEYLYDVVVISNVLNETGDFEMRKMIEFAQEYCNGVVIVVEPGTSYGNDIIHFAAQSFMRKGGNLLAPYVGNTVVVDEKEWIHFSQKIERPDFQKRIRKALREDSLTPSDIEEAKFTFVVWSKTSPIERPWGRLIQKPEIFKGYVELTVLTAQKVEKVKVLKRNKELFHFAKNLHWGDPIKGPSALSTSDIPV